MWYYSSLDALAGEDTRVWWNSEDTIKLVRPEVEEFGLRGDSYADHYVSALYWAFSTMTTVGYGDIRATNDAERVFSIFAMLLGAIVFGYIVGSMASIEEQYASKESQVKEKIDNVKAYMADRGVKKELQARIIKYYQYKVNVESFYNEEQVSRVESIFIAGATLITHSNLHFLDPGGGLVEHAQRYHPRAKRKDRAENPVL